MVPCAIAVAVYTVYPPMAILLFGYAGCSKYIQTVQFFDQFHFLRYFSTPHRKSKSLIVSFLLLKKSIAKRNWTGPLVVSLMSDRVKFGKWRGEVYSLALEKSKSS